MNLSEKVYFLGVRGVKGKKDPSRTFYNVDFRSLDGYNQSFGCTPEAANAMEKLKFGDEVVFNYSYYPQRINGFYGLGRLTVIGIK